MSTPRRARCSPSSGTSRASLGQRRCDLGAQLRRARGSDARTPLEVELRLAERTRVVEELEREADLAAEELRSGDVDRPRLLEGADAVDAARGEVAERECEGAHDTQPVGDAGEGGGALGDERRQRRLEAEDLDALLRPHRPKGLAVEPRALAAAGRPLLAGAEVVDVGEGAPAPPPHV